MFSKLRSKISDGIFIEFGSEVFKIYIPTANITLYLPSIICTDFEYAEVIEIGEKAKTRANSSKVQVVKPFAEGKILDYKASELFLKYQLGESLKKMNLFTRFFRPNVFISVHSTFSEVELSAYTDALLSFGVSSIVYINEGVASHYTKSDASSDAVICKVGYKITDLLVISDNEVIHDNTFTFGLYTIIKSIDTYFKEKYSIQIPIKKLKALIDNLDLGSKRKEYKNLNGKNLRTGLPLKISVDIQEVRNIVLDDLEILIGRIKKVIEKTSSNVLDQVVESGITLTGGGIGLGGIEKFIEKEVNLELNINTDIYSSVKGLDIISENAELLENYKIKDFILL